MCARCCAQLLFSGIAVQLDRLWVYVVVLKTKAARRVRIDHVISHALWRSPLVFVCLMLWACSSGPYEDPIATMLDRGLAWQFRRQAVEQVKAIQPLDSRCAAAWHQLIWEPGYPHWQRREAIDHLMTHDERGFQQAVAERIARVTDWHTLRYLLRQVVTRCWTNLTPSVIRSYARLDPTMDDERRPERQALEQLNDGQSVPQVAWSVLANPDPLVRTVDRVAAWVLLGRLLDRENLRVTLIQMRATDRLVADLQAAVSQLNVLPLQVEEVLCLTHWRDPDRRIHWQRAVEAVARLSEQQRQRLQLRHIPVILQTSVSARRMSLTSLRAHVEATMGRQPPQPISRQDRTDTTRDHETFSDQDELCWADWETIRQIHQALLDHRVVRALFNQADADHHDTGTEYGGVLIGSGGRFQARGYRPRIVRHDRIFYPPPEMIEKVYTSLAHYHFHAQSYRNDSSVGPGIGDLRFARRTNFNCVVLTFVDRDRLAAHYYQGNGAVVDLGVMKRTDDTGQPRT